MGVLAVKQFKAACPINRRFELPVNKAAWNTGRTFGSNAFNTSCFWPVFKAALFTGHPNSVLGTGGRFSRQFALNTDR